MIGFSDLLKSNFGDSVAPSTTPLEPRLKDGQDAAATPSPPTSFNTLVGELRVPRDKDPRKPSYEMTKDARQGVLSGFLRSGHIFGASDFIGLVNPKTAIITLNDIYEYQTRCLVSIGGHSIPQLPLSSAVPFRKTADKGDDDGKTLRNLFYISINRDELPSFHFWTKPGDLDPMTTREPIDWGKYFDRNPLSPATAANIAISENERKNKVLRGAEEQQNTDQEKPLDVLDHYSDINLPGQDREPTSGRSTSDVDQVSQSSALPIPVHSPIDSEVLLQFNRGGMYLREFSLRALYNMACWLVKNEEEDEVEVEKGEVENSAINSRDMFLDILSPEKNLREEKIVSVSRASNRNFEENIKPLLGRPDTKFRIRSTRYQSLWNLDSAFDSGGLGDLKYDLKLVRPNVGYCYASANWHLTRGLELNSVKFEKAIEFLFDWEGSAHPNSDHLSLDIPDHGSFDLNRTSDMVVDANIQKIFAKLSVTPAKSDSSPSEIFIRDIVDDDTDASDILGIGPSGRGNDKNGEAPYGYSSMEATKVRGGFDLSLVQPQLLTVPQIIKLQERLRVAEASIVESDDLADQLKVAEDKLFEMTSLQERLKVSEDRARLKSSCPFCPQDWTGVTKQQQRDHLKLHQKSIIHQPASQPCPQPDCHTWLGENQIDSTHEAISEHLRFHIEEEHAIDGICDYPHCHTNMYALTGEQQEEHESIHCDNRKIEIERDRLLEQVGGLEETLEQPHRSYEQAGNLEDIVQERDQLRDQVKKTRDTVMECDRLHQQVSHLQDAANDRDRLEEDLEKSLEERRSLQNRCAELEMLLKAAPGLDKGMQTEEAESEIDVDENSEQPARPEISKKLLYCNVCLKSVDKMSANAKATHAGKCKTNVSKFSLFELAEAKAEREKQNQSRDPVAPRGDEGTKEGPDVLATAKERKRKAPAKVALSGSQQNKVADGNTIKQPEASKTTGRKTLKRKNDTFKPPKDDESDDEEPEPPRKNPKPKVKTAKVSKETAPARKSTRGKDIYQPSEGEENDEEDERADDELSSTRRRGKRMKQAAAVTTISKKAKTKK